MAVQMSISDSLPQLTAELQASSIAQNTTFDPAWNAVGNMDYPSWQARLKLSWFLGDDDAQVERRNSRFARRQAELEVKNSQRGRRRYYQQGGKP